LKLNSYVLKNLAGFQNAIIWNKFLRKHFLYTVWESGCRRASMRVHQAEIVSCWVWM